jgi:GNAT superfamily N-acetyltransferase
MPAITYRVATPDDIETLAALRWEMEVERQPATVTRAEFVAAYSAAARSELEQGTHQAWLAAADGEVIAGAVLIWWLAPPNMRQLRRRRGLVTSVYTRPAYRRQGIARQLMRMLIDHARAQGIQRLILWPSDAGEPLYRELGFAPSHGMELDL